MKSYGLTNIGLRRRKNEDAICFKDSKIGIFNNIYIVADGVGGKTAGEVASSLAVKLFCKYAKEKDLYTSNAYKGYKDTYKYIIDRMNEQIYQKSSRDEKYFGMCTTFLVVTIYEKKLYAANIGDSRLYILGKDKIEKITEDHNAIKAGLRSNIITKALGDKERIEFDYYEKDLTKDESLLLCSDGLTRMVSDEKILETFNGTENKINRKANELIKLANAAGGVDNISVILVE